MSIILKVLLSCAVFIVAMLFIYLAGVSRYAPTANTAQTHKEDDTLIDYSGFAETE